MEIKRLVDHIQALKLIRNTIEVRLDSIDADGDKYKQDVEDSDRAGLRYHPTIDWNGVTDGYNNVKYALKQLNQGIADLEAVYRRAIRFKETEDKNNDIQKDKGDVK